MTNVSEQRLVEAVQDIIVAVRELAGVTTDAQAKAAALAAADNQDWLAEDDEPQDRHVGVDIKIPKVAILSMRVLGDAAAI